jgi:hypothetical protein
MPEEEKLKQEPMVDIDTSGPDVEVNLEEEKQVEEPKETVTSRRETRNRTKRRNKS